MKKKNFVTMVMGTIGGILFALGMCMALQPEWNALGAGVVLGIIGAVILLAMIIVRRKMSGKPAIVLNGRTIGVTVLGIIGALVFGVGMCMTMVFDGLMVQGIIVGIIGIVLCLCLIPAVKGIK